MNSRIKSTLHFTAGVFYGDQLLMNNYRVSISATTNTLDNVVNNIALERIKYFIHYELTNTVFINSTDVGQCRLLLDAGVKITTLPDEPVDQIINIMLYSKLDAIVENQLIINDIELSSDLGDNIMYFHGEGESLGPLSVKGWWMESNLTHCELGFLNNDKVVDMYQARAWRELDLAWPDETPVVPAPDNRGVFADFGKDETK